MRFFMGILVLIGVAVGGFLVHRELVAGLPVDLPAPGQLRVSAAGASLAPDGWTNAKTITLSAVAPIGVTSGLDAEVRPQGQPFTNTPTESSANSQPATVACASNASCAGAKIPSVRVSLADGHYLWQVRLHNGRGVSPWMVYRGGLGVDTTPPTAPTVQSSTDPNPQVTYHSATLQFAWQGADVGSGVAGYSYRLDTDPQGTAGQELRTSAGAVTLQGLNTGSYYFHVRAQDRTGNWGPDATVPVRIDVTPPGLSHVLFSTFQFDPLFDGLGVSFATTRPARSVHVGVYRQSDGHLMRIYTVNSLKANQNAAVTWDGKDAIGQMAGAGTYEVFIRATDQYGHSSLRGWRDFVVNYQRIVVSLGQQKLVAYDGNHLLLTSLVTTGNRALPTPTGTFHIEAKFHPFTFRSPWPKSSPYYYPPSPTQFAMLFREGGYFIHDAPWRAVFGPGSNAQLGKPGNNYTGTHGCINVPPDVAQRLFGWAKIGTVVQVVP